MAEVTITNFIKQVPKEVFIQAAEKALTANQFSDLIINESDFSAILKQRFPQKDNLFDEESLNYLKEIKIDVVIKLLSEKNVKLITSKLINILQVASKKPLELRPAINSNESINLIKTAFNDINTLNPLKRIIIEQYITLVKEKYKNQDVVGKEIDINLDFEKLENFILIDDKIIKKSNINDIKSLITNSPDKPYIIGKYFHPAIYLIDDIHDLDISKIKQLDPATQKIYQINNENNNGDFKLKRLAHLV